jgi:predicted RNA-binding protein YlqC (UPF0109 family)
VKPLVEYIARALVDKPDQVELRTSPSEGGVLYELKVAPEDIGKVIGRQGRTARSLRAIVAAAASKRRRRVVLEIAE